MSLFSERLKSLRGNMSQAEAAAKIGITAQTLGRYENEQRKPDSEVILMLCKYYKVSADYLLGLSDVESVDPDIQATCELIGLSEEAVNKLSDLKEKDKRTCVDKIVLNLIENDEFFDLVSRLYSLVDNSKRT